MACAAHMKTLEQTCCHCLQGSCLTLRPQLHCCIKSVMPNLWSVTHLLDTMQTPSSKLHCKPVYLALTQPGSPHSMALEPVLLRSWPRYQVAGALLQKEGWPLQGVMRSPEQPLLPNHSLALCATPQFQPPLWHRRPQLPWFTSIAIGTKSHKYAEVPNRLRPGWEYLIVGHCTDKDLSSHFRGHKEVLQSLAGVMNLWAGHLSVSSGVLGSGSASSGLVSSAELPAAAVVSPAALLPPFSAASTVPSASAPAAASTEGPASEPRDESRSDLASASDAREESRSVSSLSGSMLQMDTEPVRLLSSVNALTPSGLVACIQLSRIRDTSLVVVQGRNGVKCLPTDYDGNICLYDVCVTLSSQVL